MVTPAGVRAEIAAAIEAAGIKSAEYVAETVTPPLAVVVPGEPYLSTPADTPFGHHQINLSVLLIAGKGTNKAGAAWIDAAVLTVLDALDTTDADEGVEVSQPGHVQLNGNTYLGVVLSLSYTARLG